MYYIKINIIILYLRELCLINLLKYVSSFTWKTYAHTFRLIKLSKTCKVVDANTCCLFVCV